VDIFDRQKIKTIETEIPPSFVGTKYSRCFIPTTRVVLFVQPKLWTFPIVVISKRH